MGKELFFPNGCSAKGPATDFIFDVRDFQKKQIAMDDTVAKLYEQTKLKLLRFYICTKEKVSPTDHDEETMMWRNTMKTY